MDDEKEKAKKMEGSPAYAEYKTETPEEKAERMETEQVAREALEQQRNFAEIRRRKELK